jgi:hypothetical protein
LRTRTCGDPQTGHVRQKFRQSNTQFDTREMCTHTDMRAVPKRPMHPGIGSIEIYLQGIFENAAVEISEGRGEHNNITFPKLYAAKDLVPRDAAKGGSNTEATQKLFDCDGNTLWVIDKVLSMVGIIRKKFHKMRQLRNHCIQSTDKQHHCQRVHFSAGEVAPIDLKLHERLKQPAFISA